MATRNQRVRVNSSDAAVSTRVHAPSALPFTDEATRKADALQRALGIGTKAFEQVSARRHAKAVLIGTQAALEGRELTEDERKRDSIILGYESVRTEREIVDLKNRATALYQNSANKGNPAALQEELDGLYREMFGGLDPEVDLDRAKFRQVRSAWGAILDTINQAESEATAQALQDDLENDLTVLARDEYASTGRIDWDALHDKIMETAKIDGTRANEIMAATARELAETNADPELLDSIPDNWANGHASFKTVPRFADALAASRRAAENQRDQNIRLEEARSAAALKARQQQNSAQVMSDIIDGKSRKAQIGALVLAGELTPEEARALVAFEGSPAIAGKDGDGSANYNLVNALEIGLRLGTKTQADVIAVADQIGSGREGHSALKALLETARLTLDDRLKTPDAVAYRDELKARSTPLQSPFDLNFNGDRDRRERTAQATLLRLYDENLLADMTPLQAMRKAIEDGAVPSVELPKLTGPQIDAMLEAGEIDEARAIELYNQL